MPENRAKFDGLGIPLNRILPVTPSTVRPPIQFKNDDLPDPDGPT